MSKKSKKNKHRPVKSVQQHYEEMNKIKVLEELAQRDNLQTPDFLDLKLEPYHYVFVYGTLKTGGRLTGYLDDCPFLGEGVTAMHLFEMKISKSGHFPIIFEVKDPRDGNPVSGEIYIVDHKTLLTLDQIESNGEMYIRKERWVWLLDQHPKNKKNLKPCEKCFVYEGNPTYWQGRETLNLLPTKGKALNFSNPKEDEEVREEEDNNPLIEDVISRWGFPNQIAYADEYADEIPF
jgi:gamma-glutamylcyclotransferase (GGCT)/AIG2-like uncharacterized protein YtfP